MRIHSDSISDLEIRKAARIAGVQFTRFGLHGSRSHEQAFDVILTGSSTRHQNGGPDKAATWDEWGIFLGTLFNLDAAMVCGTVKRPIYASAEHFHWSTGGRYAGTPTAADFARAHNHKWEFTGESMTGTYWVHECGGRNGCGAVRRFGDWEAVSA
jgi:hypothetical protein